MCGWEGSLVGGLALEFFLIEANGAEFDVGAAAVLSLLVLDRVLDHEGLVLVAELGELGAQLVEPRVGARLDALVLLGIVKVLARRVHKLARSALRIVDLGIHPSAVPTV